MEMKEAITKIEDICRLSVNDILVERYAETSIKEKVLDIIYNIDEPQKVVIPKYVSEWVEECKAKGYSLREALVHPKILTKVRVWFMEDKPTYKNQYIFARAWLDGYEVEEEKLYYVHLTGVRCGDLGYQEEEGYYDFYDRKYTTKTRYELTETEINDNFPWAWDYAKEV